MDICMLIFETFSQEYLFFPYIYYILRKNCFILNFRGCKLTYDKYLSVTISYFTSYSKQKDKYLKLSPIGYIEKIITFLIFTELKNHIAPNTHKDFLVNLALDINIPSLDTALVVKIDKRSSTTDIKCPICILNYTQFDLEKTTLPCGHALCKTCLLKLFKSNITPLNI